MSRAFLPTLLASVAALVVLADGPTSHAGLDRAIAVIKPGKGSKRALRYRIGAATQQRVVLRSSVSFESTMDGARQDIVMPTTEMRLSYRAARARGGHIAYQVKVTDADVKVRPGSPPSTLAVMKRALGKIVGLGGSGRMNDRGVGSSIKWSKSGVTNPNIERMLASAVGDLDYTSLPLPASAVGAGAVWQVRSVVRQRGMRLVQTATYELVRLEGDKGTIRFRVSQTAPRQRVELPGVMSGKSSPTLVSYRSHGSGTITFDLTELVAQTELKLKIEYTMRAHIQNADRNVGSKLDVHVKIVPE